MTLIPMPFKSRKYASEGYHSSDQSGRITQHDECSHPLGPKTPLLFANFVSGEPYTDGNCFILLRKAPFV